MPRGQKTCPQCNTPCGPRTKQCSCGHTFILRSSTAPVKPSNPSPSSAPPEGRNVNPERSGAERKAYGSSAVLIHSPVGSPPLKPRSLDVDGLTAWAKDLANHKHDKHGMTYGFSKQAVLTYLRMFFKTRQVPLETWRSVYAVLQEVP